MIRSKLLYFISGLIIFSYSCKKDLEDLDQYKRPDWLAGKLYTQIKDQPELTTFAHIIELTGIDTVINTSGTYTVFAPDNNAFALYLQNHPEYSSSVDNIPKNELLRIVKFHIIKDPWSAEQLRQLDIYGWIDSTDESNNKPKGFKRETLLRNLDTKYGVILLDKGISIVDTLLSPWYRRQTTDANKYASIFYKEYLDVYDLNSDDYEFYFKRPFENSSDMYYMDGRITKSNVFAENGFIHIIDRVVEPVKNAYEILNDQTSPNSYTKFLGLINAFPSFTFNRDKTNLQPGAREGLKVDSLFDISYPALQMDILNEKTLAPYGSNFSGDVKNVTIRYHYGLVAPTNQAVDEFERKYLIVDDNGNIDGNKWGGFKKAPAFISRIFINSQMSENPIYPSSFSKGFVNADKDKMPLDPATIVQQQFASNTSFIGVNKALVPKFFSSIAGPVLLNKKYSYALYGIDFTGLFSALKTENVNYSLFVESDENCRNDSSFLYTTTVIANYTIVSFLAVQVTPEKAMPPTTLDIPNVRMMLLNHIATSVPKGIARKEFLKTLSGNYIIVDNQTGVFSGTGKTKLGFRGYKPVDVVPSVISTNAYNGKTYEISNWFSFSAPLIYLQISTTPELSKFHALLKKAGYASDALSKYSFLSDNEYYTVFAPTNAALTDYNADTMSIARLQKFLKLHFVQGSMIFTDGSLPPKYYETARPDEKSTPFTTYFTKLNIEPGVDVINIKDINGNNYLTVSESATANVITGRSLSTGSPVFPEFISTQVVHQVDKVLLIDQLDKK